MPRNCRGETLLGEELGDIFQSVCDEIAFGTLLFVSKTHFNARTVATQFFYYIIVFYTLVCYTETACIPPARRSKSPSAAGLLPYRILEGSVR